MGQAAVEEDWTGDWARREEDGAVAGNQWQRGGGWGPAAGRQRIGTGGGVGLFSSSCDSDVNESKDEVVSMVGELSKQVAAVAAAMAHGYARQAGDVIAVAIAGDAGDRSGRRTGPVVGVGGRWGRRPKQAEDGGRRLWWRWTGLGGGGGGD
ncbi:hypothetical protein ABZP36_035118 [Zizania latifolia]